MLIGARAEGVVERVLAGEVIAYCSDAGMPGVSDPGLRLVSAARAAGRRGFAWACGGCHGVRVQRMHEPALLLRRLFPAQGIRAALRPRGFANA